MRYTQCRECTKLYEGLICTECGTPSSKTPPDATVMIDCFKSGYFENIALQPIYCGSRDKLRAECKEHGVTSHYLN